jgi:transposase
MNTITTTASATTSILAIDLGKYKSVACVHDRATGEFGFTTFETTRTELRKLVGKEQPAVIVIEACLLAGWVHDLCSELGVRCLVANTASEAWKFKHLKRKTDKDDALRLVQLYLLGQLPTVTLPPTTVRQWRSLIANRQALVGRRIAVQNRIRALFVAQGLPAPRGAKAWTETGLAGIATQAKSLAACEPDELWRGLLELSLTEYRQVVALVAQAETRLDALGKQNADVILLETAPGLGPRTAETVAAYVNDAARFKTSKQVSAYSGMVPRQHQSFDQTEDVAVGHFGGHSCHDDLERNVVEEPLDVGVEYTVPLPMEFQDSLHRHVTVACRPEPIRIIVKDRLEDGTQKQPEHFLSDAIPDCGDAERTCLPVPFGDVHTTQRQGPKGPVLEPPHQGQQVRRQIVLVPTDVDLVNPRRAALPLDVAKGGPQQGLGDPSRQRMCFDLAQTPILSC